MSKLLSDNDLGLDLTTKSGRFTLRAIKAIAKINKVNALYEACAENQGAQFARKCVEHLEIKSTWSEKWEEQIPTQGAFIAIANLPHGALDGLLLIEKIMEKRPDCKIITGFAVSQIPALKDCTISVDNFENDNNSNFKGVRIAKNHLTQGHPLIIFPAQKLTSIRTEVTRKNYSAWNHATLKFIFKATCPILPIYISGRNSLTFRLVGKINSSLQLIKTGSELFKQFGREISIEIGNPINDKIRSKLQNVEQMKAYLRANITLLCNRAKINRRLEPTDETMATEPQKQLIDRLSIREIDHALTPQNYLLTADDLSFYVIDSKIITSLDPSIEQQETSDVKSYIVGFEQKSGNGVSMTEVRYCDLAMLEHGIDGLYTHRFFEYSHKYFDTIRRSIELGERQVALNYHCNRHLSELIWISGLVMLSRDEQYRYLIGTSGIAADYSNMAKLMISTYVHIHANSKKFAKMAIARHSARRFKPLFDGSMIEQLKDLELANKLIADSDSHYSEMPRTLEALLRKGAQVLALSANQQHKEKLNALMIVDIEEVRQNVPRGTME